MTKLQEVHEEYFLERFENKDTLLETLNMLGGEFPDRCIKLYLVI
jgi:hypothetical protein